MLAASHPLNAFLDDQLSRPAVRVSARAIVLRHAVHLRCECARRKNKARFYERVAATLTARGFPIRPESVRRYLAKRPAQISSL